MNKDTYYFSHDYGARNDPKIVKLFMKEGMIAIGIYWCLIEMLYEQSGVLKQSEIETYAFALRVDCELLKRVINDYGLFELKGKDISSNSVNRRLEMRTEKSQKASNSAKIRWNNANALQTDCDSNAIKERKGKENKGKEIKEKKGRVTFTPPLLEEVKEYFELKGITTNEYERFFYFYESKDWNVGKSKMKNWKAAVSGWISRSDIKPSQVTPIVYDDGYEKPNLDI